MNLYDTNGASIHSDWAWGDVDIAYQKTLGAGVYYVEVDYHSDCNQTTSSGYDLSLKLSDVIDATPTPSPGDGDISPAPAPADPIVPVGYTKVNLANTITYLETHQNEYNDQIVL